MNEITIITVQQFKQLIPNPQIDELMEVMEQIYGIHDYKNNNTKKYIKRRNKKITKNRSRICRQVG